MKSPRHILLLTIETLRADHMSVYGYPRPTTPYLEKLAEAGALFEQCYVVAPRTWQSFASIVTGLYPHRHGVRFVGDQPLASHIPALGSILQARGWTGFGLTGDLGPSGILRGFERYDPRSPWHRRVRQRISEQFKGRSLSNPVISRAASQDMLRNRRYLHWLHKNQTRPTFALLRYYTPHWPYNPPEAFVSRFEACQGKSHRFNDYQNRHDLVFDNDLTPEEIQHAIAHYDGAIAYTDHLVENMIQGLEALGLIDQTLIVITADHGEGLGDHGYWFEHGDQLYDEALRVPLLIIGQGIPAGRRLTDLVQNIDILPTVLDIIGVDAPIDINGVSLLPLANGESSGRPYVFAESGRDFHGAPWRTWPGTDGYLRMVRSADWKLIYTPQHLQHKYELYDLRSDPQERHDCAVQEPAILEEYNNILRTWMAQGTVSGDDLGLSLAPELADHLRSLGYLA